MKHLTSLMRERSLCVRILQYLWSLFPISPAILKFIRFVENMKDTSLKLLLRPPVPGSSTSEKIRRKFLALLSEVLSFQSIPPFLCNLCTCSTEKIQANNDARYDPDISLIHWTVGAFFFLRYLIPLVTARVAQSGIPDSQKKGLILIGRFLMKLSSRSEFPEPANQPLNDLIIDCFPILDKLCEDTFRIGVDVVTSDVKIMGKCVSEGNFTEKCLELYDFLQLHQSHIESNMVKSLDLERKEKKDSSAVVAKELFGKFKALLSV